MTEQEKDARKLLEEADLKATSAEMWQGQYEKGEEQGDRDVANGVTESYAFALEKIKTDEAMLGCPQPYWLGYVKGYEDAKGETI
jgi:hypothetical protein